MNLTKIELIANQSKIDPIIDIHGLTAVLIGSLQIEYRIQQFANILVVTIKEQDLAKINISEGLDIHYGPPSSGKFFKCQRIKATQGIELTQGDIVKIEGILNYVKSEEKGGTKKTKSLFEKGEIRKDVLPFFEKFIAERIGISLSEESLTRYTLTPVLLNNTSDRVHIKEAIFLQLIGQVENPELTKKLEYSSIGKRKSYGFGGLSVEPIDQSF